MIIGFILPLLRKKNKKLLKTIYHELGHLYVALLFDNFIPVTQLVIGKKGIKAKTGNNNWNGGVAYNIDMRNLGRYIAISSSPTIAPTMHAILRRKIGTCHYQHDSGRFCQVIFYRNNLLPVFYKAGV